MIRFHLSAAATFVYSRSGRALLEVSVCTDDGNPVLGLRASSFAVTELHIKNEQVSGNFGLRVESIRKEGPAFYSMMLANDALSLREDLVGTHILSVTVAKRQRIADVVGSARLVVVGQGFIVTSYTVI